MAPPQLRCRDLKPGDVMLQESLGNAPGKVIAFGQFVTAHQHTGIVHAGIMFDSTYIVEAPTPTKSSARLDALMDEILAAKPSSMFCSQFVVITYQIAAGQLGQSPKSVLPLGDARVAPARLASALEQSSWFSNAGYMKPNERS